MRSVQLCLLLCLRSTYDASYWNTLVIHCLHDFAHEQDSQLNSSVIITVWRVVIEKSVTGLNK